MPRPKGSKNKHSATIPLYTALSLEERLILLANLIVERIVEDQAAGGELLQKIGANHVTQ